MCYGWFSYTTIQSCFFYSFHCLSVISEYMKTFIHHLSTHLPLKKIIKLLNTMGGGGGDALSRRSYFIIIIYVSFHLHIV